MKDFNTLATPLQTYFTMTLTLLFCYFNITVVAVLGVVVVVVDNSTAI